MTLSENTLLIGIGNSGRGDDGIGWAVLDRLRADGFTGPHAYRYQLNIEDAELISHHGKVLMIDADHSDLPGGFRLEKVQPEPTFTYSTHQISPAAIAYLCEVLFDARPTIYLLRIQGCRWGLGEGLSKKARDHSSRALTFLKMGSEIGF